MHPTKHGMDGPVACELPHVDQGIDQTGMGAPQQHHDAPWRVEVDCLIVDKRVARGALFIEEEVTTRILEVRYARNRPRDEEARESLRRLVSTDDAPPMMLYGLAA